MFIIFGTSTSELASEPLEFATCDHCGNETLVASLVQRYFHLFWIPTIPLSRSVVTECMHCRQVLVDDEVPAGYARALEPLRATRTPAWSFAGVMVVGAVMLIGAIGSLGSGGGTRALRYRGPSATSFDSRSASVSSSTTPTWDLLHDPRAGDVYVLDFVDAFDLEEVENRIGILQATEVGADSVTFRVSELAWPTSYDATTALDEDVMTKPGFFFDETMIVSREMLIDIYRRTELKVVRIRPIPYR